MIRKEQDQEREVRRHMRGAPGEITIRHYFKKEEINAKARLCAELIIPPGAGVGEHAHNEEGEVYIIQQGKGSVVDNGKEVEVVAGDAVLTGKGSSHSIKNIGGEDLLVTAVIMQY